MIQHPNIQKYLDYCEAHPEELNELRKLLIKNIVRPILRDETVFFDAQTYEKCLLYCERNYFPLFDYQKFIYAFVFMYRGSNPIFSAFLIEMGRGNGKTSGFMPLMNFLQTPLYGVKNYHIDIIANNEDQAKKDFGICYEMLEGKKEKFRKSFYWTKGIIKNKVTRSELRFNTSNARTKDGKEGGALIFDEFHAYENYDQIKVFTSQLGKVKHPRTFIITTQGYVRDGPLDDKLSICKQILKTGENELKYFPFLCELDSPDEADKEECWVKANPSLPYMPVLLDEIKKQYAEMKQLPSMRAEFMTKRMNLPDREDEITVASWDDILAACYDDVENKAERKIPDIAGRPAVLAMDYADIRDFVSAGLLFKIDGEYIWRQHTWICSMSPFFKSIKFPFENYGSEGFTDFEIVEHFTPQMVVEWCVEEMQKYAVCKIVMDTYRFSLFREAFENYGIPIESRSNPYGIVRMIRHLGSIETLTAPLIEQAFVNHKINFGNSAIMRWYVNNTSVYIDKNGNKQYGKIEPKLRKNDGFMAFVIAMSCEQLLEEQVLYI